nr:ankyrin repeat domain-containing protein [Methylomarinum sp. Ch1-1]MDP4522750.1 ankyrin repeat domain-containing protein [Methylomarinum sp. Ch1-1]
MLKTLFLLSLLLSLAQSAAAEDANDLFAAAIAGKNERLHSLLAQGIEVNAKTTSGRTALMGASFNGNVRAVKILLNYGADVNIADDLGSTALMDALVFGDQQIVSLLIATGADVNAVDKQNISVLAKAKKHRTNTWSRCWNKPARRKKSKSSR